MHISDRISGEFEITEPILVDLITSKAVQRLKGIAQFGLPDHLFNRDGFSRYEHCVGVMVLLRTFGASTEEQAAGLLHDVSHTAFSHVIDFVVEHSKDEDFQDRNHEAYMRRTDIPAILEKYGMTVEQISEYHRYSLLEQDAPALCADRLDYAFREFTPEELQASLPNLTVHDGRFVFVTQEAALAFAHGYLRLQMTRWGGYEVATRYDVLSRMLKRALELNLISMNDFWENDTYILERLVTSPDDFIRRGIALLEHRDLSFMEKETTLKVKKFRWVDPDVVVGDETRKLSELSPEYAVRLASAREENAKGVCSGKFE